MKERPIVFSTEMVRTILEGRKTQTRRLLKPQPGQIRWAAVVVNGYGGWVDEHGRPCPCPYGRPGDRLWVRERHTFADTNGEDRVTVHYSDETEATVEVSMDAAEKVAWWIEDREVDGDGNNWRSPIHMPRWASRITLEIINVRAERLQEISLADALAEGIQWQPGQRSAPVLDYAALWDSINSKRGWGWEKNPWVWVLAFTRVPRTA